MWKDVSRAAYSALRRISRNPGEVATAVLLFAIATLAHATVGTFVRATLLNELPYPSADRIFRIVQSSPHDPSEQANVSYGAFLFWSEHAGTFDALAAFSQPVVDFLLEPSPGARFEPIRHAVVTEEFFDVLGVTPALGRTFDRAETAGGPVVIVVSDRFWRTKLGADPHVIGTSIRGVRRDSTIIGVMPRGFDYPSGVDVWIPASVPVDFRNDHVSNALSVIARLTESATRGSALAELEGLRSEIERQWPGIEPRRSTLVLLRDDIVGDTRAGLLLVYASALLLFGLSCATVLNILIVDASRRADEFAIRASLGAAPRHLTAQVLTEGVTIALLGGACGLLGAWWAVETLVRVLPSTTPRLSEVRLDAAFGWLSVLAMTILGLLWGALLSWRIRSVSGGGILLSKPSASPWLMRMRAQQGLLAAGMSVAFLALFAGGHVLAQYASVASRELGFDHDGVLAARLHLSPAALGAAREKLESNAANRPNGVAQQIDARTVLNLLSDELLARVGGLAAVESVALTTRLALADRPFLVSMSTVRDQHEERPSASRSLRVAKYSVTDGYFRTMGIEVRMGRLFTRGDRPGAPPVAILNQTAARRLLLESNPIGKYVRIEEETQPVQIVGVVQDTVVATLAEEPTPQVYLPFAQTPEYSQRLVVKTRQGDVVAARLDQEVGLLGFTVLSTDTLKGLLHASLGERRARLVVVGVFALAGLIMVCGSVFAGVSRAARARRHELSVRLALGATPWHVCTVVAGYTVSPVVAGIGCGYLLALATRAVIQRATAEVVPAGELHAGVVALVVLAAIGIAVALALRGVAQTDLAVLARGRLQ